MAQQEGRFGSSAAGGYGRVVKRRLPRQGFTGEFKGLLLTRSVMFIASQQGTAPHTLTPINASRIDSRMLSTQEHDLEDITADLETTPQRVRRHYLKGLLDWTVSTLLKSASVQQSSGKGTNPES